MTAEEKLGGNRADEGREKRRQEPAGQRRDQDRRHEQQEPDAGAGSQRLEREADGRADDERAKRDGKRRGPAHY